MEEIDTAEIDAAERRRRLAVRHGLVRPVPGGSDPVGAGDIARRMVALHATDPGTVFLSMRARAGDQLTPAAIEDALYGRREVVRMLAMRRTVFVVPAESVPVVQAAASDRIARDQRSRLVKLLSDAGVVADPDPWLADLERSVLAVLRDRGEPMSAAELGAVEPRLKTTVELAAGKPYAATANITSRVLLVLAAQGEIVRGRPIGTWLSQQYRWSLTRDWLPEVGLTSPAGESEARAELARQWLTAFGPAPLADLKWWTGWTMAQRQAGGERRPGGRGQSRRRHWLRAARRPGSDRRSRPLGRLAPGARLLGDGLVGPVMVPRPARPGTVRHQRQRWPDDLAGRSRRGRLGPARLRRDRAPPARGHRLRGSGPHRTARRTAWHPGSAPSASPPASAPQPNAPYPPNKTAHFWHPTPTAGLDLAEPG